MFARTTPDRTPYNRQQFLRLAERAGAFQSLAETMGAVRAHAVADLLFEKQLRETSSNDGADGYVLIPNGEVAQYPERIDRLLRAEVAQIQEKQDYVADLLEAANAGRLRARLAEMTEPEENYTHLRGASRDASSEREVAKAAGWVGRSMHGEGWRLAAEILTRHVLAAPSGAALGRTPRLLDQIHKELAPDAPRKRSPNIGTAYPSSIGGRYLLELIFQWTADADWPVAGDARWLDAALFYLGAVTTVQGYTDGNKRTGRMAYAITLLKGGRPFAAPRLDFEAALIRMTPPPSDEAI